MAVFLLRTILAIAGILVLLYQIYLLFFAWTFVRLYGKRRIPRPETDGIGKPVHGRIDKAYIRNLISTGYAAYHELDLAATLDLLLQPHLYNLRVTEEIEPNTPIGRHTVTRDIQLGQVREQAPLIVVPVAVFPKGVLIDGLTVLVDGNPANVMSYDESLRLTAALLFMAHSSNNTKLLKRMSSQQETLVPPDQEVEAFRNHLATSMYEIVRPANSLTNNEKAASPPPTEPHTRAEILVEKLRTNYTLYAIVETGSTLMKISYSRTASFYGKSIPNGSGSWRRRVLAEVRFRLGQFPFQVDLTTPLIYECQSYHLKATLPNGLFVHSHQLCERTPGGQLEPRQQQDFAADTPINGWADDEHTTTPTYMRARDHRALPYAHFYARNGYYLKRILHTHVIHVSENPFATLKLASTILFLSAIGAAIAGISITNAAGTYSLKGGLIAIIVSTPGIVSSWARQVFGVEALQRSSLTTQSALRMAVLISMTGLILAVIQDTGVLHWSISVHMIGPSGPTLPIYDGYWLILNCVAVTASVFLWCRYNKRRMQYLAMSRRALVSTHNWFIGEPL